MTETKTTHVSQTPDLSLPIYKHRQALYEELHTRPSPKLSTPCHITHLALLRDEPALQREHDLITELCLRFSVHPPAIAASCFYQSFSGFELRWERHTEFSTYTFIRTMDGLDDDDGALAFIPKPWLN